MRTVEQIAEELEAAATAQREAVQRVSQLRNELTEARINRTLAAAPAALGKIVTRKACLGMRRSTITRRGRVTIYDPRKHFRLRELPPMRTDDAGRLIVVSDSGETAHLFDIPDDRLHQGETKWEIAE